MIMKLLLLSIIARGVPKHETRGRMTIFAAFRSAQKQRKPSCTKGFRIFILSFELSPAPLFHVASATSAKAESVKFSEHFLPCRAKLPPKSKKNVGIPTFLAVICQCKVFRTHVKNPLHSSSRDDCLFDIQLFYFFIQCRSGNLQHFCCF